MDQTEQKKEAKPGDWQALSKRQSVLFGMLTISLLGVLWAEEIGFAIVAGVVILVGFIATYSKMKSAFVGFVTLIAIAALLAFILPNFIRVTDCYNPEALAKQNLHIVQMALERYAYDNGGYYPGDIEVLREEMYLPTFPENRYFYNNNRAELREMKRDEAERASETINIYQLDNLELNSLPGNFAYLPIFSNVDGNKSLATGYKLLGFAKTRTDEKEYITTILILENDSEKRGNYPFPGYE